MKRLPLRHFRRIAAIVMVCLVVAFLALWFGLPPHVPRGPLRLVRSGDGELRPVAEPGRSGLTLEAQYGRLTSKNSVNSATSVTNSDQSRFAAQRVVVAVLDPHPLLERVGRELLEKLKQLPDCDQLDYLPPGHELPRGDLKADVFIRLALGDLSESGIVEHRLDAHVLFTVCDLLARDNHSRVDERTLPGLEYFWGGDLHHQSTTSGLSSSAAKYRLAAADIAGQFATAIIKQFHDWRGQYGELPQFPSAFYPTYREPPSLPYEGYDVETMFSSHGLFKPNETFWTVRAKQPAAEALAELQRRLQDAGWKSTDSPSTPPQRLRLRRDEAELCIYPPSDYSIRPLLPRRTSPANDAASAAETTLYAHYDERISPEEQRALVGGLIEKGDLDTALLFRSVWTDSLHAQALETLIAKPPTTSRGWLLLAELSHGARQDEQAIAALRNACVLNLAARNRSAMQGKIQSLAKTLGHEDIQKELPSVDTLKSLGFAELTPGAELPTMEFGLTGAANYFGIERDDKLHVVSIQAMKNAERGQQFALVIVQNSPGMQSIASGQTIREQSPTTAGISLAGIGRLELTVMKMANEPVFQVGARLLPETLPGATASAQAASNSGTPSAAD